MCEFEHWDAVKIGFSWQQRFHTCLPAQATLVVNRLIRDHDNTAPQLRKAFSFKDALAVHQAGGAFLHFLSVLQKMAPAALYTQAEVSLRDQFSQGFMDADLLHVITTGVPPGDIKSVGSFRLD